MDCPVCKNAMITFELDDVEVGTKLVVGPNADKPLALDAAPEKVLAAHGETAHERFSLLAPGERARRVAMRATTRSYR